MKDSTEREGQAQRKALTQRRALIGIGSLALLGGAGLSAWRLGLREPADEASALLFGQSFSKISDAQGLAAPGQALAMHTLRGKVLVVNFWATWCAPCVEEMPDLSDMATAWQKTWGDKVETLGVGIDTERNIAGFYQKIPVKYPLLLANQQGLALMAQLGNTAGGLPFTLLIDRKGTVTHRILGRFDRKILDDLVRKQLGQV